MHFKPTSFRLIIVLCLTMLLFLISFMSTPSQSKIVIAPKVSISPLTEHEYSYVGTSEIKNPTIDDFKKLVITLNVEDLEQREITFPSIREVKDVLTREILWFSSGYSQDNPKEGFAQYGIESVIYTRNLTDEELRDKLRALEIKVSYKNEEYEFVGLNFNLGDILSFDHQPVETIHLFD